MQFFRMIVAFACLSLPLSADDAFLEKPYVQLGDSPKLSSEESLVLLWHAADAAAEWKVEVRTSKDPEWRTADTPSFQTVNAHGIPPHRVYRVSLTKLVPGEEFRYRVSKAGQQVFESEAHPRKSVGQSQHFVLFGDCAQDTPSQRAIAYQTALAKPDFVFITGDIVYSTGRISEYRHHFYPVYNAEKAATDTGAPLIRSTPFIAAPGNHDTALRNFDQFPDALAYFLYWDQPLNGPVASPDTPKSSHLLIGSTEVQTPFLESAKPRYPVMANFSFDYGNAHWTVLDSNSYMDWTNPALRDWVRQDLAQARGATWRFVAFHHPGFNSSHTHFNDQWMRTLAPVFEAGNVDIVFSGHVHNYQRSYPLTFTAKPGPDGKLVAANGDVAGDFKFDKDFNDGATTKPKGVIYIVTGGGGAELYDTPQQAEPATWQPFTKVFVSDQHSFSLVDIDGKTFRLKQISESGKQVDAFQISKF